MNFFLFLFVTQKKSPVTNEMEDIKRELDKLAEDVTVIKI